MRYLYKNMTDPEWLKTKFREGIKNYIVEAVQEMSRTADYMYTSPDANFELRSGKGDMWRDEVKQMPALLKTVGLSEDLLKEIKVPASTN